MTHTPRRATRRFRRRISAPTMTALRTALARAQFSRFNFNGSASGGGSSAPKSAA